MTDGSEFSAEQTVAADYLGRVAALAPEIAPLARRIDADRDLPEHLAERLHAAGLFRLLLPRALGGAELSPPSFAAVIAALGKIDASVAWCIAQTAGCSMVAAFMSPAAAARVFHAKPWGLLAWGPGPGARAVATDGGYRVTGTFAFASGSHLASWLGAACTLHEPDGTPRTGAGGVPVMRHMLFPREAAPLRDDWRVIGLKGTGSDGYEVAGLFVPDELAVGRDDQAERRDPSPLYNFPTVTVYAFAFASVALGVSRAMLDAFMALAAEKTPRGQTSSLARNPVVQTELGMMEARWQSASSFLSASLETIWAEVRRSNSLTLDQRMTIRMASSHAMAESVAVADWTYHAAGATAIFESNAFERRFRDIHSVSQQIQGRRAHFETVGSYLMGGSPSTAFL